MRSLANLVTLLLLGYARSQDPLTDFCRRFSHQTGIIDNKLFIDGGLVDYGTQIDASTVNYTNTYLLWADLSTVNEYNFPPLYNNLSKPSYVPSLAGGTIWSDDVNKLFYLYGGEFDDTTLPPSYLSRKLWLYDALYNTWNNSDVSGDAITTSAYGAGAYDPNRGVGYYYGGWISDHTAYGIDQPTASAEMIVFDGEKWTAVPFYDQIPRAEGALFYIPASDAGMLIYFGGVQEATDDETGGYPTPGFEQQYTGVDMSNIYLYDIASQKWYLQQSTGGPPGNRRNFCGGASWPEDQSSYNIYIYGGLNTYETEGFGYGDVWILSIPSFTWTLYWTDDGASPHHSASCNIIQDGQMIVMGGYFPNSSYTDCDVPNIGGMHNLNLGANDIEGAAWYQYLPNITDYTLPPNLTAVIGGSTTGDSTNTSPAVGWASNDLEVLLPRKAPTNTRTPTRSIPTPTSTTSQTPAPSPHSTNVGAIAGGVVGGVAGLLFLILIACLCLRRRKRQRSQKQIHNQRPSSLTTASSMAEVTPQNYRGPYIGPDGFNKHTTSSSIASSPELAVHQWTQSPSHSPHGPQFREDLPAQVYYPPPPQAQPYYPPPPAPQTSTPGTPTYEMPSGRSPVNIADTMARAGGNHSPVAHRQATINED